jgi:hypothetical protein
MKRVVLNAERSIAVLSISILHDIHYHHYVLAVECMTDCSQLPVNVKSMN